MVSTARVADPAMPTTCLRQMRQRLLKAELPKSVMTALCLGGNGGMDYRDYY